ncbi:hypothetical protein Dimus_012339 [Dionaea muscipula]
METTMTKGEMPCTCTEQEAFDLLNRLQDILERDPLIDEVGFIHPNQLLALSEDADAASPSPGPGSGDTRQSVEVSPNRIAAFWNGDHKLGISTHYLLPLYTAARQRFVTALGKYKTSSDSSVQPKDGYGEETPISLALSEIEMEVMRHSKALLLLCSDFGTAWNLRKLIGSKKQFFRVFEDELQLSTLVLSFAPKTEYAWSHRRWVIKMITSKCSNVGEILERESNMVEKLAEKSKMNYRAWNHRSWLVAYMSKEQVFHELTRSRDWAGLHVADNSCFHYRRRLLLRMLDYAIKEQDLITRNAEFGSLVGVWKEEMDWNEKLIKRYIGREALWLHRRFLSISWAEQFLGDFSISDNDMGNRLSNFKEHELQLHHQCSSIQDSDFEDYTQQAVHSAGYIMWLNKQVSKRLGVNFVEKPRADDLNTLLHSICPDKNLVWDYFL